jgi:hypothetical protein
MGEEQKEGNQSQEEKEKFYANGRKVAMNHR